MTFLRLRLLGATGLALLLGASHAGAAEVYRCVSGTHVEYRDQPCASESLGDIVPVAPAGGGLVLTQASARGTPDAPAPVTPGMSPRAVHQALGRPLDMRVRIEGITPIEQWWYRTPDGMLTITFRYGRVASAVTR